MSCGVGYRHSLDLVLLWLWYWLAAAAPIQPLAQELPNAVDVTRHPLPPKIKQKKKKKERKKIEKIEMILETGWNLRSETNQFDCLLKQKHQ